MAVEPNPAVVLVELLTRIEAELAEQHGVVDVLSVVVGMAARQIRGADHAGITLLRDDRFETLAASSDLVRQVDAVQYEVRSGPCVDAAVQDTVAVSGDLGADERWPAFGERAAALGITSMLSVRLYLEGEADTVAAVNLYAAERDAFEPQDEATVMAFAAFAASAIAGASAQDKAHNLTVALTNSREIGIAIVADTGALRTLEVSRRP